jgi:hypothetical protein
MKFFLSGGDAVMYFPETTASRSEQGCHFVRNSTVFLEVNFVLHAVNGIIFHEVKVVFMG